MTAPDSLAVRSVTSGAWLLGRRVAANAIRLAALAVLARRLEPADFGLAALAQVLLSFVVISQENGVATYVVYDRSEEREERLSSAFWLSLTLTLAQVGLLGLIAPFATRLFPSAALLPVLLPVAGTFVLRQLQTVPEAILRRSMEYRKLVARDTACDLLAALLSVVLALRGWGVWSLVLPHVAIEPIRLSLVFWLAGWRPGLDLGLRHWRAISRYALPLMGSNALNLVANDGDTLLVGRLLGSQALGFYNLAWQLSNVVGRNLVSIASTVGMSAFALVANDLARLREAYLRSVRLIALLSFPTLAAMLVLANDVVLLLYGPNWTVSVTLLRILILFTIIRTVTTLSGVIFNVMGRTDLSLWFTIVFLPFYVAAIVVGARFGLVGVAWGVTLVRSVGAVGSFLLASRLIGLPQRRTMARLAPVCVTTTMTIAALFLAQTWSTDLPLVLRLALCMIAGGLACGLSILLLDRHGYRELVAVVRSLSPPAAGVLEAVGRWAAPSARAEMAGRP